MSAMVASARCFSSSRNTVLTLRNLQIRLASSTSVSPSSKIRVVPFRLTPLEAEDMFDDYKQFAGDGATVKGVKPIYWPMWQVDALLKQASGMEGSYRSTVIAAEGAYLRGNPKTSMATGPFYRRPDAEELPVHNPKEHLDQLGPKYPIASLPFLASPFAAMEKLRRETMKSSGHEGSLLKNKCEVPVAACYPIYFPLYIAEIESEDRNKRLTCVMEAHTSHAIGQVLTLKFRDTAIYVGGPKPSGPIANMGVKFPLFSGCPLPVEFLGDIRDRFPRWLSPESSLPKVSSLQYLLLNLTDPIDWNDSRIQSWSGSGRAENRAYVIKAIKIWKRMVALKDCALDLVNDLEKGKKRDTLTLRTVGVEHDSTVLPTSRKDIMKQLEGQEWHFLAELGRVSQSGWMSGRSL